jgi:signal transduction histidine kinase
MKVRTRLVAAFAYVTVTIIVALTIPLAISLDRRARTELERENLIRAGTIAQGIGGENLGSDRRAVLAGIVSGAAEQADGRVIVVDAEGRLIADSQGPANGQPYATPERPELQAALRDQPTSVIRFSQDLGTNIMATAVPIIDESSSGQASVVGAVRITRSMDQVDATVHRVTLAVIGIGLAGLAVGLILAVALSTTLSRPLRRLAGVAQRFGSGDLSVRAGDVHGPEEVEDLATSFDAMADRVEDTVQAQREFVGNASHQLRTPLTGMKLRLESAIAGTDDPELRAELSAAEREVDRLAAIVNRLLATAAHTEVGAVEMVDLRELADAAADRWRAPAREADSELVVEGPPGRALAHPEDVDQILDNLLGNALAYAPGRVELRTATENGRVMLTVRDHGGGIAHDDLPHVTERFYRGAGERASGSGLGLAIVRELAERDGGTVEISDALGGGTRIDVSFPSAGPLTGP